MAKLFGYGLDAINPDAMTPDDLAEATIHLETLVEHCLVKHRAMELRASGKVTLAAQLEDRCDALYQQLPENWQW
jgi:hypothetical protein